MTIPAAADAPPNAAEVKPTLLPPPAPLDGFAPDEFKRRRDALRAACPDGLVLVRGASEDDVPHGLAVRYRQESAFFYLTGVDTPGGLLVLLPEAMPASAGLRGTKGDVREVLFLPPRDATREAWTGPKLGPGEETEKLTGVAKTAPAPQAWNALAAWVARNPVVYTLAPYGERARASHAYALMQRVLDVAPVAQFRDASMALAGLRVVKSPAEVDRIRAAVAVSAEGQRAARAMLARAGGSNDGSAAAMREYEVEARVFEAFRARGGTPAFASIVGGGANGTTLHYEDNAAELKPGDLVVVDVGARVGHYCGDLTRTYPVGGRFGERHRAVYDLVREAHRRAVAEFRCGEDTFEAMNERCKKFLKDSPLRSVDGGGTERTMDHFMPHGLGHHLGLDVHDVGDREPPLPAGSVITIEPGVYLPGEGIGVRLENDYLVTPAGLELLGPPLEMDAADVERAMREAAQAP